MPLNPIQTARYLLEGSGLAAPKTPPYDELVELARAYLATVDASTAPSQEHWYVPTEAVLEYQAAIRDRRRAASGEAARRELTELLLTARPVPGRDDLWRARRRSSGLDVSIQAQREGGLLVVRHVGVRER